MKLEDSLVAMAEAWLLIFVVIVQQLSFSSVSFILRGPNKVSLVNRMKRLIWEQGIFCTECKGWLLFGFNFSNGKII